MNIPKACSNNNLQRHPPSIEINSASSLIQSQIRDVEIAIAEATQTRSMLYRQFNEKNDLTIDFPIEVLSKIFIHACKGEHRNSPIVLSHVCSRWRGAVLDTPQAWGILSFKVHSSAVDTIIDCISHHMENIGPFTLDLSFIFLICMKHTKECDFPPALQKFLFKPENSEKIGRLELSGYYKGPEWIPSISSNFSRLECLELKPWDGSILSVNTVRWRVIPNLSTLRLINVLWIPIAYEPLHITTLHLKKTCITTCFLLFLACHTTVIELHCTEYVEDPTMHNDRPDYSHFPQTVTFPQLEEITFDYNGDSSWTALWNATPSLPTLRRLSLKRTKSDRVHNSDADVRRQVEAILCALGLSLLELRMAVTLEWDLEFLKEVFGRIESVELLDLSIAPSTAGNVIRLLTPELGDKLFLPGLKWLRIDSSMAPDVAPFLIIHMLRNRMARKKMAFRLDIFQSWPSDAWKMLRQLAKAKEWELEVWEKGQKVEVVD